MFFFKSRVFAIFLQWPSTQNLEVFEIQPAQVTQLNEAGGILRTAAGNWRELVSGFEGSLEGHMMRRIGEVNSRWGWNSDDLTRQDLY